MERDFPWVKKTKIRRKFQNLDHAFWITPFISFLSLSAWHYADNLQSKELEAFAPRKELYTHQKQQDLSISDTFSGKQWYPNQQIHKHTEMKFPGTRKSNIGKWVNFKEQWFTEDTPINMAYILLMYLCS